MKLKIDSKYLSMLFDQVITPNTIIELRVGFKQRLFIINSVSDDGILECTEANLIGMKDNKLKTHFGQIPFEVVE